MARHDDDLWEDQVPPHAPGVPGNEPESEEDGIDHGVAADGVLTDEVVEPVAEPVEAEVVEEEPTP